MEIHYKCGAVQPQNTVNCVLTVLRFNLTDKRPKVQILQDKYSLKKKIPKAIGICINMNVLSTFEKISRSK